MGCGASNEPAPTLVGELKLTLHQARGLPDKDIGAMDPYCNIFCGDDERKTKTHDSGGIEPKWVETVPFNLKATEDDTIDIEIWDDDPGFDDFVAQVSVRMDVIIPTEQPTWFTCYSKDGSEPAGEIQLSCEYVGSGKELCGEAEAWEDDGGEEVGLYEVDDGVYIDNYGNTVDADGNILTAYDESGYDDSWGESKQGYTVVMIAGRKRRVRRRAKTIRVSKGGNRVILKIKKRNPPKSRRAGKGGKGGKKRTNKARQRAQNQRKKKGGKGGKGKRGKGGKGGKNRGGKGGKGKNSNKGGKGGKNRGKGGKGGKKGGKGGKRR